MTTLGPLEYNGSSFPIELCRNKRAKRIILRICPKEKAIRITLPQRTSVKKAEDFIVSHQAWIEQKLGLLTDQVSDDHLGLLGEEYTFKTDPLRRKAHICHKDRCIYLPKKAPTLALKKAIIAYAQKTLMDICNDAAENIGQKVTGFSFRDTKSRWGSCSSQGKIMLSWRLILAPEEVARYVCIHEVCHLEHMNHSPEFWSLVAFFDPHYKRNRNWLKKNGNSLFGVV